MNATYSIRLANGNYVGNMVNGLTEDRRQIDYFVEVQDFNDAVQFTLPCYAEAYAVRMNLKGSTIITNLSAVAS